MQMVPQYQNLLSGTEILESQLRDTFPEYLNAEIVLRNVTDVAGAVSWLKSTFLYVRVWRRVISTMTRSWHAFVRCMQQCPPMPQAKRNPSSYGLPQHAHSQEAFEKVMQEKFIFQFTRRLAMHGLVR